MYLLDTSVASDVVGPPGNMPAATKSFMNTHGGDLEKLYICSITIGEMRFGRELLVRRSPVDATRVTAVDATLQALSRLAEPFAVNKHVANEYATIRANYAKGLMPQALDRKVKGKHVETWHQQVPPSDLQITENDLWIAAVAVTHDMTLVSRDKDFTKVKEYNLQLNLLRI